MTGYDLDAVGEHWSKRAQELEQEDHVPTAWTDSQLVNEMYINPLVSGNPHENWLAAVARRYFPEPVERAMSLGCGSGGLERHGANLNVAMAGDAFDVSRGAVDLARRLAEDLGISINYQVADLNRIEFPEDVYDAVFACQSIHHISELEHLYSQVQRALKPQGLFIINEYVGPNRFQWTDRQLHHAQRLLCGIPARLRHGIKSGTLREHVGRSTIARMIEVDPTEAVRSAHIIPELTRHFDIVEKIDFGGTVLHPVLEDIAGNFADTQEDRRELQRLFDAEQDLLTSGELESDFTVLIASHKGMERAPAPR